MNLIKELVYRIRGEYSVDKLKKMGLKVGKNFNPQLGFELDPSHCWLIEIGDNGLINRKQWASTYRDNFRWPRLVPISNPGILSDMAKSSHKKLDSIN